MRGLLEFHGVPARAIRTEVLANSTRQSALHLREVLAGAPGRKVLLTSDYHMFRAHRAFENVGLKVLPRPCPDARQRASRWMGRWPAFLDLVQEAAKIAYYFLRGWM